MKGFILATMIATSCNGVALASEWIDARQKDELTGKPTPMYTVSGQPALHQFGRAVSVKLVLTCTDLYQGKKQYEEQQFYTAFLWFSEEVGIADPELRYTIDGGEPVRWTTEMESRGRSIHLSTIKANDAFIVPLSKSRELKVQLDLPWAGKSVVTFKTAGAVEAMKKIPCHDGRVSRN